MDYKIVEIKEKTYYFKDLKGGDVFVTKNNPCPRIKLATEIGGCNAIKLDSGYGSFCACDLIVTPLIEKVIEFEKVVY